MKIELIRGSHSITETNMHLQITPAFRQDIFEDEIMRILVRDYMLAQLIKGFTSIMMRTHHWDLFRNKLYGDKFWSGGYFARTVGAVNADTVKRYVEQSQEYKTEICPRQKTLIQFAV